MTQALYAHMNNKTIKKILLEKKKDNKGVLYQRKRKVTTIMKTCKRI
jgi:hypothetical protein